MRNRLKTFVLSSPTADWRVIQQERRNPFLLNTTATAEPGGMCSLTTFRRVPCADGRSKWAGSAPALSNSILSTCPADLEHCRENSLHSIFGRILVWVVRTKLVNRGCNHFRGRSIF